MGLYSDAILRQMGQIGKPIRATSRTMGMPTTSTSRTTVKPPGPSIDIMQMLMMLLFSGAFQQKGGKQDLGPLMGIQQPDYGLQGGAAPGAPWTPPGVGTTAGSPITGGMGQKGDLASLMKILMSIPGMGGIPGM